MENRMWQMAILTSIHTDYKKKIEPNGRYDIEIGKQLEAASRVSFTEHLLHWEKRSIPENKENRF